MRQSSPDRETAVNDRDHRRSGRGGGRGRGHFRGWQHLTDESRRALDLALALASPTGARVALLHVIERIPNLDDRELHTFYDQLERDGRSRLHALAGGAPRLVPHL